MNDSSPVNRCSPLLLQGPRSRYIENMMVVHGGTASRISTSVAVAYQRPRLDDLKRLGHAVSADLNGMAVHVSGSPRSHWFASDTRKIATRCNTGVSEELRWHGFLFQVQNAKPTLCRTRSLCFSRIALFVRRREVPVGECPGPVSAPDGLGPSQQRLSERHLRRCPEAGGVAVTARRGDRSGASLPPLGSEH